MSSAESSALASPSAAARLDNVTASITPLREQLLAHPLYKRINSLDALRVFMQHHIFPVWDFMLLLKTLQNQLCSVEFPWVPPQNPTACRMINEIVLGEESDEDGAGGFGSHFDLYRQAMAQAGADTGCIDTFIAKLRAGSTIDAALKSASVSERIQAFVVQTCDIISSDDLCAIASAFTFGREDLLPDVFQKIVDELNFDSDGQLTQFQYYLSRHIELDADQHGPMAANLIKTLCGEDDRRWQSVETAALKSLQARIDLWDAVADEIG